MTSVLFVCTGNICRSPSAEAVFLALAREKGVMLRVDSAGTHAYHIDDAPDPRSQAAAHDRGLDMSHIRARQVSVGDFEEFDYILVMDSSHYAAMLAMKPETSRAQLKYLMEFAPTMQQGGTNQMEVPDPYYGGTTGFEYVLDLIELAAEGFFDRLIDTLTSQAAHDVYPSQASIR